MKVALIMTTVNIPTVLQLYRKLDPSVKFFVAADHKTPLEAYEFCGNISDCEIYSPERQKELGYECSELLGWNTDSRRNIALLEALKWGAELIISVDDDMLPIDFGTFVGFERLFKFQYNGLSFGIENKWFDAGAFTNPPAKQRGLPVDVEFFATAGFAVEAKIGAAQGVILGTPDTDAMTAITNKPSVTGVNQFLYDGFVVYPHAYSVCNSQFTAFRRELAPAFAQFYNHQGRNTDIFASALMRRIMRDRGLYTYFGPPMGFHARQPRPLFKDLKAEMYGLEHIAGFAEYLQRTPIEGNHSVVDDCRDLIANCPIFSDDFKAVAEAWYNDCEKVL